MEGVRGLELSKVIADKLKEFGKSPYYTLYIVDPIGSGADACMELAREKGIPYINCGRVLSDALDDVDQRYWGIKATDVLREVLPQGPHEVAVLADIHLLFTPEMDLNVIQFIEGLRACSLLVLWPGFERDGELFYSEPDNADFCKTKVRPYQLIK
ncbi:MAG: hypothetical protein FD169_624 [Bacillota bacterium]|nr:MAG: hypothetical protein FD169_624 [Bacillota bacterium]